MYQPRPPSGMTTTKGKPGDVALDAGAPHPDRVVVGKAMEEIEDRPGPGDLGIVGEDDVERRRFLERPAVIVDRGERHEALPEGCGNQSIIVNRERTVQRVESTISA